MEGRCGTSERTGERRGSKSNKEIAMKGLVWAVCLFVAGSLAQLAATPARSVSGARLPRAQLAIPSGGLVRTYYIAAEES